MERGFRSKYIYFLIRGTANKNVRIPTLAHSDLENYAKKPNQVLYIGQTSIAYSFSTISIRQSSK